MSKYGKGERTESYLKERTMNVRIRKLYRVMKQNPEFMRTINSETEEEVKILLKEKSEGIEDLAFHIMDIGEEGGFVEGFKYAVGLMAECFPGSSLQNFNDF